MTFLTEKWQPLAILTYSHVISISKVFVLLLLIMIKTTPISDLENVIYPEHGLVQTAQYLKFQTIWKWNWAREKILRTKKMFISRSQNLPK